MQLEAIGGMTTTGPRSGRVQRPDLPSLTALRFFAAILIVGLHARGYFGIPRDFLRNSTGTQPVSFFFALSGFILAYCYPALAGYNQIRSFCIARFARIWPIHIVLTLTAVILSFVSNSDVIVSSSSLLSTIFLVVLNFGLLHGWVPWPPFSSAFNGVSWSISVEFFFYLVFPWLVGHRHRIIWALLLALSLGFSLAVICSILGLVAYSDTPGVISASSFFHLSPFVRISEFLAGVLTCGLFLRFVEKDEMQSIESKRSQQVRYTVYEVASLFALVFAMLASHRAGNAIRPWAGNGFAAWLIHCGSTPVSCLVLWIFALHRGHVSQFLSARFFVLLGEISFSIYMIHNLYFATFQKLNHPLLVLPNFAQAPVYLLFLLAMSYLSWRFFETPANRYFKRLLSRPQVH